MSGSVRAVVRGNESGEEESCKIEKKRASSTPNRGAEIKEDLILFNDYANFHTCDSLFLQP